jgi:type IV pilus assembly protein PilA
MRKLLNGEKGFTLVEMMVVLIIITVLIALGIRMYIGYIAGAKVTKAKGDLTTMSAALDSYYATNQNYPQINNTALTAAGLSTAEVTSQANGGGMYFITTDSTGNGYLIYTAKQPDGVNYVCATGVGGVTSTSPYTTPTLPASNQY